MKKLAILTLALGMLSSYTMDAQLLKKKKKKDPFKCGYIHKKTLKERLNVSALAGRALGGLFVKGSSKFDLGQSAITIVRSDHIQPSSFVDYAFKTPGWETCGSMISSVTTSKVGIPLVKASEWSIDGTPYKSVAFGQYFQGFSAADTSSKKVKIGDSNGDSVEVTLNQSPSFEIVSVNGKSKGDTSLVYNGEGDIVIELNNTVEDDKRIGVEVIQKMSGVRFNIPVFFTEDKKTITIPEVAFKSGLKFHKDNILIVYKFKETVHDEILNSSVRTIESYYDFTPLKMEGSLTKSALVKIWKKENQKIDDKDLSKETVYDFAFKKQNPLYFHPSSEIKKIVVPSFVLRANLQHQKVDVTTTTGGGWRTTTTTTLTKWFPKLSKDTWQELANRLNEDFETAIKEFYNVPLVSVKEAIHSKNYDRVFPIQDTVTKSFVEVGAFGSKRVMPSLKTERTAVTTEQGNEQKAKVGIKGRDVLVKINTFPSDFVTNRVMKEYNANCAITVNFDLEFDIQAEALLPIVAVRFFAPQVSLNEMHYYQDVTAYYKESISLKEVNKYPGSLVDKLYKMINGQKFIEELKYTLGQVKDIEKENTSYQDMWNAMH